MQKFTQKYTIIALLENTEVGYEFSSDVWPLHITIADTFAVAWSTDKIIAQLTYLSNTLSRATAISVSEEYFGPKQQTHVVILDESKALIDLHYKIVGMLKTGGLVFNDPQYAEAGFRPHATVQPYSRLSLGETVHISKIALIDMFPDENPYRRKVLNICKLN